MFSFACWMLFGYTIGMKTAVSIPNDLFEKAETLARNTKKSRSQLYSEALFEYVVRHSPEEITLAYNKVVDSLDGQDNAFLNHAALRAMERTEW